MKVLEEIKPSFLYSLHNSAFGGAYWYISDRDETLVANLPQAAQHQDIPLSLGEPEMPCCKIYSTAVFEPVAIRRLVSVQLESGLRAALRVRNRLQA